MLAALMNNDLATIFYVLGLVLGIVAAVLALQAKATWGVIVGLGLACVALPLAWNALAS